MELAYFFRFLLRHSKALILIPVVTVVITYFLVRSLPNSYLSQAQIATGIVDRSSEVDLSDAPPPQPAEVEQKFSNLIQLMKMEKLLTLVSYKLIARDLLSSKPYRSNSMLRELSSEQRKQLASIAKSKYNSKEPLSKKIRAEDHLNALIHSLKYDPNSLKEKLSTTRLGQSDYIEVKFESTDPYLSAFVVNSVSVEFINYYTSIIKNTGERSVNYLSNLLAKKKESLNQKMNVLKHYKITNGVLNLPEQAKILYGNMIEVQDRQGDLEKEIVSVSSAIRSIESKFNARDRRYFEAAQSRVNNDISLLKEKARVLSNAYIDNDFDPAIKKAQDSLNVILTNRINDASDEYIYNPLVTKQDLIAKKIALQVQLDLAKNSVNSLNQFHAKLLRQFSRLVPFEASIQSYERDIEIASQEYLDILDRYNSTTMQTVFIAKLKLSQPANPGSLQPSKKMLLIILSGIISVVFCIIVLFGLFYFDDSIQTVKMLADKTQLPVIGQLEYMPNSSLNIKGLWEGDAQFKSFKDALRAIRMELNQELKDAKILAVTSFSPKEGKSFATINIAYAYAVINKKVLIIDGNFLSPDLSKQVKTDSLVYIEDFFSTGNLSSQNPRSEITIIGNKGGDKSVLEISDHQNTLEKLSLLKSQYDLILIETPSLVATETSKEWILYAEKVIGIFEYKSYVTELKKPQLEYLQSLEDKFSGWIFNKVQVDRPKASWFKKS